MEIYTPRVIPGSTWDRILSPLYWAYALECSPKQLWFTKKFHRAPEWDYFLFWGLCVIGLILLSALLLKSYRIEDSLLMGRSWDVTIVMWSCCNVAAATVTVSSVLQCFCGCKVAAYRIAANLIAFLAWDNPVPLKLMWLRSLHNLMCFLLCGVFLWFSWADAKVKCPNWMCVLDLVGAAKKN